MEKGQQRGTNLRTTETNSRDPSSHQRESDAIISIVQTILGQESDCYTSQGQRLLLRFKPESGQPVNEIRLQRFHLDMVLDSRQSAFKQQICRTSHGYTIHANPP